MDNEVKINSQTKENSFYFNKHFKILNFKKISSKLEIINLSLKIDMNKLYFGFINAKKNTYDIPINSIEKLEVKTKLSLSELLIAAIILIGGILITPFLFLIVPFIVYTSISSYILISTKQNGVIKIPFSNKKDADEFIQYFYEIYI